MANTVQAVAVDTSPVIIGDALTGTALAQPTAESTATSVDGSATAAATVTEAVGVLDSTISAGGNGTYNITETGVANGSATTVNKVNTAAGSNYAGVIGQAVISETAGATLGTILGYITTLGNGTTTAAKYTPLAGGAEVSVTSTNLIGASSAYSAFTGNTGGFIDTVNTATNVDFTAGAGSTLDVQVGNTVTSTATNTDGGAYATGLIAQTYGLKDIGVSVGGTGTLTANVDADVASTATTTGSAATPAAAIANTDATTIAAISDLGNGDGVAGATFSDFAFGDKATITANAGTASDKIVLSAVATTVGGDLTGDATATVDSTAISGITDGRGTSTVDNVLSVGSDATITARAYVDSTAKAVTVDGDASAKTNLGQVDGIQADTFLVGADAGIKAYASTVSTTTAQTTDLTATAENTLTDSRAIQLDNLTIGDTATATGGYGVIGAATANLTTTAATSGDSTTEFATATGTSGNLFGVQLGDGLAAVGTNGLTGGANLSLAGTADLTSAATATAVDGAADATSRSTTAVTGVSLSNAVASIGAGGTILATGSVNLDATASNVGLPTAAGVDDTVATASAVRVVGFEAIGDTAGLSNLTIGDKGSLTGTSTVAADAIANSVTSDAKADSLIAANLGIDLGTGTTGTVAQTLDIGAGGTVVGTATGVTNSKALTTDGNANAITDVDLTAGLGDGLGILKTGADGTITGTASSTSSAVAATTDAVLATSGAVNATVDNDIVSGINLTSITTGAGASIIATANSGQTATASNVGDIAAPVASQVTATVAAGDAVTGLASTIVGVGADLSKFSVGAQLTGTATASNVNDTGISTAASGVGSDVIGIDGSPLTLGGSATAGLRSDAISNLTATATGVAGAADADAGSSAASVIAINNSDIGVGGSANTTAVAASTVNATASSTKGAANADAFQTADGILDTNISLGNDGNVIGQATLVGNATSTTVGVSGTTNAIATSNLDLSTSGIDLFNTTAAGGSNAANAIVIGDTGNVTGNGFASGASSAQSTVGAATATGEARAQGIDLTGSVDNDITINGTGNISGLAVVGTLVNGALGDQVNVTAATTIGAAGAAGDFDAEGIIGTSSSGATIGSLLTAGPSGGNITGQVIAGGNVTASSTGDSTTAGSSTAIIGAGTPSTTGSTDIFGIKDVNIVAGQSGSNLVRGTSLGNFDATAIAVKGPAVASSDVNAYGIFDTGNDGNISVNGGLSAIAQLSNTVTATSVAGSAVATAASDVIGLSGYTVNIIGSGSLNASAISDSRSTATSVGGAANA